MNPIDINQFNLDRDKLSKCMLEYSSALHLLETQLEILRDEFKLSHQYNPIEHINTRLKSIDSIIKKMYKKGLNINIENMKEHIYDIVGARIVCSFKNDVYDLVKIIEDCNIFRIIEKKDYIKNPKESGYSSFHLKIAVLVPFSKGSKEIKAEIQIRTMAMDFWASIEHKLSYKFPGEIPEDIIVEFKETSGAIKELDNKMSSLVKRLEECNGNLSLHAKDEEI